MNHVRFCPQCDEREVYSEMEFKRKDLAESVTGKSIIVPAVTTLAEKSTGKANLLKVQFALDPSMSYIEASKLLKHLKKRLKNLVKRYLKSNRMASTDIRVKLSHTDAGALYLCINVRRVELADEREAATNLLDILRTHMFGDETLSSHIREKAPAVWDWMTDPTPHHQLFKHESVFNNGDIKNA